MKICPLVYFSVHKTSSIQHSTCTRTALFPWRIKSCAQRCCTRGFLHIHPSIPAVFQRTGSGLASRTLPDAFLRCPPGGIRDRLRSVPGRWQQPLAGGTEHPPRLGRERPTERSHSVFAEHLLHVPPENLGVFLFPLFFSPLPDPQQ